MATSTSKSPLAPEVSVPEVGPMPSVDLDEVIGSDDKKRHQNKHDRTAEALSKQPKERVRVSEDTRVQINGYGFNIKGKTSVEVPEQVARILAEAGRI